MQTHGRQNKSEQKASFNNTKADRYKKAKWTNLKVSKDQKTK